MVNKQCQESYKREAFFISKAKSLAQVKATTKNTGCARQVTEMAVKNRVTT